MEVSNNGLKLIKEFEGYRDKAYRCPAGVMTIGFGTTKINGKSVKAGMTCTEAQATGWLKADVKRFEKIIHNKVHVPLTQNMYDALTSFVYNHGDLGNDMELYLNKKEYRKAANEFDLFIHGGGKVIPGLIKRRAVEKALFLKGMAKK